MRRLLVMIMLLLSATSLYAAELTQLEQNARILRVQLNMLGSSGDPLEREAILREIIDTCKGTEEAEAAYWDLADLYLDAFPEERRREACEMLELSLKNYPNSKRAILVKCRLVELYDNNNTRRAELVKELKNDKSLPNFIREGLN